MGTIVSLDETLRVPNTEMTSKIDNATTRKSRCFSANIVYSHRSLLKGMFLTFVTLMPLLLLQIWENESLCR